MKYAALSTTSGKMVRPNVVCGMAKQIERYERALKLLESTYNMVSSEFPPPEDASSTKPPDEKQDEDEE